MIVTLPECKRLVQYTKDTNDTLILTLIPIVQADLCEYLNNYFLDTTINYHVSEVSFVKGSPDTITDDDSEFVKKRFATGMDIYVEGATDSSNDGIWELAGVAAGTLTLTSSNELVSMAYDDSDYPIAGARIARIVWPKTLKLVVAQLVKYLIDRSNPDGALSESIDDVTIQYDRRGQYPREILAKADKYRRPEFV